MACFRCRNSPRCSKPLRHATLIKHFISHENIESFKGIKLENQWEINKRYFIFFTWKVYLFIHCWGFCWNYGHFTRYVIWFINTILMRSKCAQISRSVYMLIRLYVIVVRFINTILMPCWCWCALNALIFHEGYICLKGCVISKNEKQTAPLGATKWNKSNDQQCNTCQYIEYTDKTKQFF